MNIKLIEEFLSELTPPEDRAQFRRVFTTMSLNPLGQFIACAQTVKADMSANEVTAAMNGMLMGISLVLSFQKNQKAVTEIIEGYLESKKKDRGENVVDLFKGSK